MNPLPASPWHKESYDTFINDQLPQLLAARLPLAGYRVENPTEQTCTITVAIRNGNGEIEVEYPDIPYPSTASENSSTPKSKTNSEKPPNTSPGTPRF